MPVEHVEARPAAVRRVLADSFVVRTVGSVWRRAARGGRAAGRGIRQADAALGHLPLPRPDPADEQRARQVLASSRLLRWIDAVLDVPPRAWRSSALRRGLQPVVDGMSRLPPAGRLRLIGWMLVVATLTHIVLVLAFGEPIGWPTWTAWTSFLLVVCVVIGWPAEVLAAWSTSAVKRRFGRGHDAP